MRHRARGGDDGGSFLEFLALGVLAAVVLGGLVALGPAYGSGAARTICRIVHTGGAATCAAGSGGGTGGRTAAPRALPPDGRHPVTGRRPAPRNGPVRRHDGCGFLWLGCAGAAAGAVAGAAGSAFAATGHLAAGAFGGLGGLFGGGTPPNADDLARAAHDPAKLRRMLREHTFTGRLVDYLSKVAPNLPGLDRLAELAKPRWRTVRSLNPAPMTQARLHHDFHTRVRVTNAERKALTRYIKDGERIQHYVRYGDASELTAADRRTLKQLNKLMGAYTLPAPMTVVVPSRVAHGSLYDVGRMGIHRFGRSYFGDPPSHLVHGMNQRWEITLPKGTHVIPVDQVGIVPGHAHDRFLDREILLPELIATPKQGGTAVDIRSGPSWKLGPWDGPYADVHADGRPQ